MGKLEILEELKQEAESIKLSCEKVYGSKQSDVGFCLDYRGYYKLQRKIEQVENDLRKGLSGE